MKLARALTVLILLGTLGANPAGLAAAVPTLHIDCSFTGPSGDLCESGARAWARGKSVKLAVERRVMTSTEKFKRYQKLLETQSPQIDVFGLDVIWPGALHKYLLDLEPYFKADLPQLIPVYIENNTVNGRLLAIPYSLSVGLLYYRKDLLEKYGVPVPDTWEELTQAARTIQAKERAAGNTRLWGYVFQGKAYEGLTCNALEWFASHGGGTFLDPRSGRPVVQNGNVLAALTLARSWIGDISPPEVLNFAEKESHEAFREGHAVFLRAWPSAYPVVTEGKSPVRDKTGVTVIPKGGARGVHASALGGWSLAVAGHTKSPELAADLIHFLVSAPAQKASARAAANGPTLQALYADPEILALAPYQKLLMPILEHVAARPARITRTHYPELSQAVWTSVHAILSRKTGEAEGMSELQNRLDQLSRSWRQ
jgi:trehalose/maltose transport system substrate-binding protein